jgi:hypothetical protein
MALNKAETQDTPETSKQSKVADEVLLVLHLYKRYLRHGTLYEKFASDGRQNVYKFTKEQAVVLLAEQDEGRSIWRRYREQTVRHIEKPKPQMPTGPHIKDATKNKVEVTEQEDVLPGATRIEIGNDDEIDSILNAEDVVEV